MVKHHRNGTPGLRAWPTGGWNEVTIQLAERSRKHEVLGSSRWRATSLSGQHADEDSRRGKRGGGRRRTRVRVGRFIAAGAATTVTVVSIVGAIELTLTGGGDPEIVVEPRASVSTALSGSSVPSSAPAAAAQSRDSVVDAARDTPSSEPRQNLQVPERASGRFDVAAGTTERTGTGSLVRYTVEVERGLPIGSRQVARRVDAVLASPKGWTAAEGGSLQRVQARPDIRIRLASPETADQLCRPLDTGGRLSCRNGDLVVVNAWRWVKGADTYAGDLRAYRQYMINHEVGHALGKAHASCAEPGRPASVMVQQTKGLDGCLPNPWPAIAH